MNFITSLLLLSSNTFLHPTTTYLQSINDSIVLVTSSMPSKLTTFGYDHISTISGVNGTNNIDYIKLLNDTNDTNSTFVQLDNSDSEISDSSSNSGDMSSNEEIEEQVALVNSSSELSDESNDEGHDNDSDDNGDEVENLENNQANENDSQDEDDRVFNYEGNSASSSENESENHLEQEPEPEQQHYYYKNRSKFYNHFLHYPEVVINNNDDRDELPPPKNNLLSRSSRQSNRRLMENSKKKTVKSKSKPSKLKQKSRKSHKKRPKHLKSIRKPKDVEINEITTVEVITLTITKVLTRHDLNAAVTPIQQHQSGHLIIGYPFGPDKMPLPIATKSTFHDQYKPGGVLKEVDTSPTKEHDSSDANENKQPNPIPGKTESPKSTNSNSVASTYHHEPFETIQQPKKQFTNRTGNSEIPENYPNNVQDIDDITFPIELSNSITTSILYSILPINQTNLSRIDTISLVPETESASSPRYSSHHSEFTVERPPRPSRTKKRPRLRTKKPIKVSTHTSAIPIESSKSISSSDNIRNIIATSPTSSTYNMPQNNNYDKQPISLSMTTDATTRSVTITEKLDKPKFPDIFTIIRSKLLSKKPQETKMYSSIPTFISSSSTSSTSSSSNDGTHKFETSIKSKGDSQTQENTFHNDTNAISKTSVVSTTTISTKSNDDILKSFIQFTETIHSQIQFPIVDDKDDNVGNNYHRRFTGVVLPENRQFIFRSASQNLSFSVLGLIVLLLLVPGLLIIIM
ncbi:conserved hypothetical protein [Candida dubliniensis CD36]|uniref:Uncharacterized protein n=1 Tax=Candida dubliniensis (strain CD36 / ATCC MYA-646 / CBS 7987 / NCPF 3949 / NRRL Y-17841) TaxID=573826 RepID=B9WGP0_CANDC|nr:conserved hypothetical protein [Candida dubliniensis CD36]CAX42416.1 conserved hypothetical protein [Candida dubliniensis CD36]